MNPQIKHLPANDIKLAYSPERQAVLEHVVQHELTTPSFAVRNVKNPSYGVVGVAFLRINYPEMFVCHDGYWSNPIDRATCRRVKCVRSTAGPSGPNFWNALPVFCQEVAGEARKEFPKVAGLTDPPLSFLHQELRHRPAPLCRLSAWANVNINGEPPKQNLVGKQREKREKIRRKRHVKPPCTWGFPLVGVQSVPAGWAPRLFARGSMAKSTSLCQDGRGKKTHRAENAFYRVTHVLRSCPVGLLADTFVLAVLYARSRLQTITRYILRNPTELPTKFLRAPQ